MLRLYSTVRKYLAQIASWLPYSYNQTSELHAKVILPPNIVKNSLKMLIYFHGNSAFSLPDFMTYGASLWDTIRLLHLPQAGDFFTASQTNEA
uniref:Uncharacterized protein n=3 Tax=Candidatus Kentrum sp. FM TaxID=2126340 RepID=A0A450T000_9GAMM|nr:MAG: hypothetical protein BECKFM1743A_GA0114220_102464 [Candidatus Kentron sp. FM]